MEATMEKHFNVAGPVNMDDIKYCLDFGLIQKDCQKGVFIANSIYKEIILSELI